MGFLHFKFVKALIPKCCQLARPRISVKVFLIQPVSIRTFSHLTTTHEQKRRHF